jgi:hypothetical protein
MRHIKGKKWLGRSHAMRLSARLLAICCLSSLITSALAIIPNGYSLPKDTISPDGCYGILVPNAETLPSLKDPANSLINAKTGNIIGRLDGVDGVRVGNDDYSAIWSLNSENVIWMPRYKWVPLDIHMIRIKEGRILSQVSLLGIMTNEILARLKEAQPSLYQKAVGAKGAGSKEEAFTIDVIFNAVNDTDHFSFDVGLTRDPNCALIGSEQLEAYLSGNLLFDGKVVFDRFQAFTPRDIVKQRKLCDRASKTERDEYQKTLAWISGAKKSMLVNEEQRWEANLQEQADKGFSFQGVEWINRQAQRFQERSEVLRKMRQPKQSP